MDHPEVDPRALRKAASFFQHANEAALKNNLDYAIQMLGEALKIDPNNLLYRQTLRGVERRRFQNDPGKVGLFATAKTKPIHLRIRGEKSRKRWERVLEVCEESFRVHPWDVTAARDAAEAAVELDNHPLACWLLESVHAQGEGQIAYMRQLAHVYELTEQYAKAIACWEAVRRKDPHDEEARRQINALSASATIKRSGLHEAIDKHQNPVAEINLPGLDDLKAKVESPVQRLVRIIKAEPEEIRNYLELSDLLRAQNRYDDAEKVLARGRLALPDEELLRESHTDIQMERLRRAIGDVTKRVELNPEDEAITGKLGSLRAKLQGLELHELKHRVEVRANDMGLRFRLAEAYRRAGRTDEAIAELQQVRNDPEYRVRALLATGQAFELKGLPKLAQRSYQDALKAVEAGETKPLLAIHYHLGKVAETLGDRAAAEEHYGEVAAIDYGYSDVAERLRALNQGR